MQLYVPILFGDAIDQIIAEHQVHFHKMIYFLGRITTLVILSSIITWFMNMINNQLTYRTVQDIRSKAIRQIQRLPLSYLDGHSTVSLQTQTYYLMVCFLASLSCFPEL